MLFISAPWIGYIDFNGKTKYMALTNKEELMVGTKFTATDGEISMLAEIIELKYFKNFGDAWFILGEKLIPSSDFNVLNVRDANDVFLPFYSESEIKKFGVVAIGVKIIS